MSYFVLENDTLTIWYYESANVNALEERAKDLVSQYCLENEIGVTVKKDPVW